ncbi:MAG: hypothetical protein LW817_05120, partial [Candidatus Caenarcaniphilales bacterium]|nr:hypothetical protein [Candidatus Caenarcaniphilales bacterium]
HEINLVIAEDQSEFINFLVLSYTYNSFFKDDFAVEQNRLENLASQYDQEKIKQSSQKIMSEIKSDKLVIDSSSNLLRISHKQVADEELVIKTFIAIQNSLRTRDQAIIDSYLKLGPGLHLMILGALHFENIAKSMKENNQNLIAISANP